MVTACKFKGCERGRRSAEGYCLMHYKRWKRHGDPSVVHTVKGSARLSDRSHKIDRTGDCWVWTGATDDDGYGIFRSGGSVFRAHRVSYEENVGPIPDGLGVLHHCDNPPCVRPDHLWTGTTAQNTEDKMRKGRWGGGRPRKQKAAV